MASKVYEKESIEQYAFSLGSNFAQTDDLDAEEKFLNKINNISAYSVNLALENIFSRVSHINLQIPRDDSEKDSLAKNMTMSHFQKRDSDFISFSKLVKIGEICPKIYKKKHWVLLSMQEEEKLDSIEDWLGINLLPLWSHIQLCLLQIWPTQKKTVR